uniref:Uncharacterized protein n=1 Tax=Avena sativa TaxID=4498 RepID=A0ACD5WAZ3_AVESA
MAPAVNFVALLVLVVASTGPAGCIVVSPATPVDAAGAPAAAEAPAAPLLARLHLAFSAIAADGGGEGQQQGEGGGWMMECFGAVTELRSCTNEIVLFFINGESWLGRDCCVAIRVVTRHCWPSILASVGFTAEEADVLRGFCDAEVGGAPAATTPPPPAPLALAPAPAAHP